MKPWAHFDAWYDIFSILWACESLFSLSWQLPKDDFSVMILIAITELVLCQELPPVIKFLSHLCM